MKIRLKVDWYKGTDGSSLSEERCLQFISLFDFCQNLGSVVISYKELQVLAKKHNLYSPADSAKVIRTFCPLLSKIGFINYEGSFVAHNLFTKDGELFIKTVKALNAARSFESQKIIEKLENAKQKIQRLGLINMHNNPKYDFHSIWIAIAFLNLAGEIDWDEFGYAIYQIRGNGMTYEDALAKIEANRVQNVVYEYEKEDGSKLANTYYSYIHSYLLEAGVLYDYTRGLSRVCDEAEDFLNEIKK